MLKSIKISMLIMSSEENIMWTGKPSDEQVSLPYHNFFISNKKITQYKNMFLNVYAIYHQLYKTKYTKYFLINKTRDVKQIHYYSAKQTAEVAQSVRALASRRVGVRIPAATNLSR